MPFEDNDPAPTLPLGVTARQFSACYNLIGIASRLIYSFTQFNQFINQLSYSVVPAPFQVHAGIIQPFSEKVKHMFTYFFKKNKKFFRVVHNTEEERGEIINKTLSQLYNESPPAAIKKAIRKRVSADAFSRRAFLSLHVFLVFPVWKRRFEFIV